MNPLLRILYAEDTAALRESVAEVLEFLGHEADTATDGADALAKISAQGGRAYDLLITDIKMPIMDGIALIRELEQTGFGAAVIILSCLNPEFYDERIADLHITAKIRSGDFDELISAIANVAARKGSDGADGLKTVLQDPEAFDLVITDIRMPVMDGIEFVRRAKRSNYNGPVIVFSAFGTDLYEQEITGLNIAATVEKGEMEKLIAAVERVMNSA